MDPYDGKSVLRIGRRTLFLKKRGNFLEMYLVKERIALVSEPQVVSIHNFHMENLRKKQKWA